jgi:hypothetical protein
MKTVLQPSWIVAVTLVISAFTMAAPPERQHEVFGPFYHPSQHPAAGHRHGPRAGLDAVRRWNEIALIATGIDHTFAAEGEDRVFGEQFGPCRASRAMAIVHIAMFDAANAVVGRYESYTGVGAPSGPISARAAIAQAAHDTLRALFPSQAQQFAGWLAEDLDAIHNPRAKTAGIELGQSVAAAILELRAHDGSHHDDPLMNEQYIPDPLPGRWRQDPVSLIPIALGAHWGGVAPFVMPSVEEFRAPPPPDIASLEYAIAYDEVQRLGGDGVITPTERTEEQTQIGIFWAYDGTPVLCAPPRLYNQLTVRIANQMRTDGIALARLLALVNVAMADAAIAVWDSKYLYDYWRPVTGIREADPGTGPSGEGDGNPDTVGDPTYTPLGAPASNLAGPNFTPPFPAYPSGHAGFGGALFQTLRRFYGTDEIAFTFVSDELNGETVDNEGNVRAFIPRSFSSLSEAEEENGQSRIYLGIHWSFDKTDGIAQGRLVGDHVFDNILRPLSRCEP